MKTTSLLLGIIFPAFGLVPCLVFGADTSALPTPAAVLPPMVSNLPEFIVKLLKNAGLTVVAGKASVADDKVTLEGDVKLSYQLKGFPCTLTGSKVVFALKSMSGKADHPAMVTWQGKELLTKTGGSIEVSAEGVLKGKNVVARVSGSEKEKTKAKSTSKTKTKTKP